MDGSSAKNSSTHKNYQDLVVPGSSANLRRSEPNVNGDTAIRIKQIAVAAVAFVLLYNPASRVNEELSSPQLNKQEAAQVNSQEPSEALPQAQPEPAPAVVPEQPKPEPAPVQVAKLPTNCEAYRSLVAKYNWNVNVAMNVMRAESGCNPYAVNRTDNHKVCMGSYGLFQISCHSGAVYDPAANVSIAYSKYQARGWQPWGVCTSGKVSCY